MIPLGKGDGLKTQENLGKAIEIQKECGADGWWTNMRKKCSSFNKKLGVTFLFRMIHDAHNCGGRSCPVEGHIRR